MHHNRSGRVKEARFLTKINDSLVKGKGLDERAERDAEKKDKLRDMRLIKKAR